jgi:FtsH-binding integral membrane protein
MSAIQKKMPFLATVFVNLAFQMFIMYRAVELTINNADLNDFATKNRLILLLSSIGIILALTMAKSLSIPVKFVLLTLFSALVGMRMHKITDIKGALLEASAIFMAMVFAGLVTVKLGYDLSVLGMVLFFALIALIFARLLSPSKEKYTKIATLIFALYVIYDTNNILQRNYAGDFVDATLDYFTDLSNLVKLSNEE